MPSGKVSGMKRASNPQSVGTPLTDRRLVQHGAEAAGLESSLPDLRRRHWAARAGLGVFGLGLGLPLAGHAAVDAAAQVETALKAGGVVLAMRHALAPGTFDPPQFRLNDCSTQRNLSEQGRAQARQIGRWFSGRGLQPLRVRSSPWCRCLETGRLAFGSAEPWADLGSPVGADKLAYARSLGHLREGLATLRAARGFEVWVTHMFVLQDLTGQPMRSGEALVLAPDGQDGVRVVASWYGVQA
jgi:phosphohistidine phosphatase SixA